MELNANVKYGNGNASFLIRRDSPGVYHAELLYFEGDKKLSPPKKITMVRGIRQWAGSCESVDLLNHLGKIIEEFYLNSSNISVFN